MHFHELLAHLEEQLTKHRVVFTHSLKTNLTGPCTTLEYITITSTGLSIAVDTLHGIRYGRVVSLRERRLIKRKSRYSQQTGWNYAKKDQDPHFETIAEYGYELTDEQTNTLVAMLIAQDLQPEYVI